MKQQNFTDIEYQNRRKQSRRDEFLKTMDEMLPWEEWIAMIRPYYPEGKRGRKPKGIDMMLRMYLLQEWYDLSDEVTEDVVYDSYAMRSFLHVDFVDVQAPSASTLLRFRHILNEQGLDWRILGRVNEILEEKNLLLKKGSLSDAVLIGRRKGTE